MPTITESKQTSQPQLAEIKHQTIQMNAEMNNYLQWLESATSNLGVFNEEPNVEQEKSGQIIDKEETEEPKKMAGATPNTEITGAGGKVAKNMSEKLKSNSSLLQTLRNVFTNLSNRVDKHIDSAVNSSALSTIKKAVNEFISTLGIKQPKDKKELHNLVEKGGKDKPDNFANNIEKSVKFIENEEINTAHNLVNNLDKNEKELHNLIENEEINTDHNFANNLEKNEKELNNLIENEEINTAHNFANNLDDDGENLYNLLENGEIDSAYTFANNLDSDKADKVISSVMKKMGEEKTLNLLEKLFNKELDSFDPNKQIPQTFLRKTDFTSKLYNISFKENLGHLQNPINLLVKNNASNIQELAEDIKKKKDDITDAIDRFSEKKQTGEFKNLSPKKQEAIKNAHEKQIQTLQHDKDLMKQYPARVGKIIDELCSIMNQGGIPPEVGNISNLLKDCVDKKFPGSGDQVALQNFCLRGLGSILVPAGQPAPKENSVISALIQKTANNPNLAAKDTCLEFMNEPKGKTFSSDQVVKLKGAILGTV
ncbi:MAG: hypothetical protein H0U49_00375 [Parachlamydiaceae bacterium]|nr:hypothetical protein [Parachlamydiaceae bacterium]